MKMWMARVPAEMLTPKQLEQRCEHERACDKRNALSALERLQANMLAVHTRNFFDVFGADFHSIRHALNHLPDVRADD